MKIMKKIVKFFVLAITVGFIVLPFSSIDAKTTKKTTTTTTTMPTVKVEDGKVAIYVFYASWCPHCQDLHEELEKLAKDKDYKDKFVLVDYRVDNEESYGENPSYEVNNKLFDIVGSYFNQTDGSIPFYVIGNQPYSGFSTTTGLSQIKSIIDKYYNNPDFEDIFSQIIDGTAPAYNATDEVIDEENKQNNNTVGIIICIGTLLLLVAIVVASKKTKYYDEK